jgi:gamma-glutamylputrescine oxidase
MTDGRNVPGWDDAEARREAAQLPALRGDHVADACVIGLGGSGLAAVGELLRMGKRVIGIDSGSVGGGAAGRNGGFLLAGTAGFHHDVVDTMGRERAVATYELTLAEMDRMTAETPDLIRRQGSLRLAASADEVEDCRRQLAAMQRDGLAAEWYDGDAGEGLFIPTDGAFQPLARCRRLAGIARRDGAALFEATPAVDISAGRVTTPGGAVSCEQVIVAVDGRLARILPELQARVRVARLQMLATAPSLPVRWPQPCYSRYGYDYWHQLPDGRLLIGGYRDHHLQDEWTDADSPSEAIQGLLEQHVRERLHVDAPVTHRWAASVAYTDDELPIFEEVREGVWAIGAYSGTGNVVGAVCGRAAARAAFGGATPALELLGTGSGVSNERRLR